MNTINDTEASSLVSSQVSQAGHADQSARKLREKDVLLGKIKQHKDETPEKLR